MKKSIFKTAIYFTALCTMFACLTEDDMLNEIQMMSDVQTSIETEGTAAGSESELPLLKFVAIGTDASKTKVIIKDNFWKGNSQTVHVQYAFGNNSGDIHVSPGDINGDGKSDIEYDGTPVLKIKLDTEFEKSFAFQIIPVKLKYLDEQGNLLNAHDFNVFVFEDGASALQRPEIVTAHFIDDWQGETAYLRINTRVQNDPAKSVDFIKAELIGEEGNLGTFELKRNPDLGHVGAYNFTVEIEGVNAGYFRASFGMFDQNEVPIGQVLQSEGDSQKADFTGRVKRIRIRENNAGTDFKTIVVVSGDTNNEVAAIEVKFDDPTQAPSPSESVMTAEFLSYDPEKQISRYGFKELTFEGQAMPIETKYTMTAQMKAYDGSNLGGPFTESIQIEKYTGRIKRIRIRENNTGTDFRIIADENIDPDDEEAAYVKVVFNDSFGNPDPTPGTAILTLSQSLPEKNLNRYMFKPLTFEGGVKPLEDIYNITATMLTIDGTPVGDPVTRDVIVESKKSSDTSGSFAGSSIYSTDGGKSWFLEVKIQNPESWVEGVEVEFIEPFEGPSPAEITNQLTAVREEPDGVVVYSTPTTFKGDPLGFGYTYNVYLLGFGTRKTASQADGKAELL